MERTVKKCYNFSVRILVIGDNTSFHTHRWLSSYREAGFEVKAGGFEEGEELCEKFPTKGKGKLKYFLSMPDFRKIVQDFKPDLIHAHMAGNYGLIASLSGIPYVISLWGPDIIETPFRSALHRNTIKRVLHRALLVHTDSHMVSWLLQKIFEIPAEKIVVFPFGVSQNFLSWNIKKSENGTYLVTHRKLEKIYGHETILRAIKILKEKGIDFKLFVASFGSESENLKRMCEDLNISDCVIFTGRLSEENLASLLAQSHIFISAALSDTTPNSLLEAMALNVFPIISDLPVYREWVIENLNGFYFEPGNYADLASKIEKAIQNRQALEHAVRLNRLIVENLADWDRNFKEFTRKIFKIVESFSS